MATVAQNVVTLTVLEASFAPTTFPQVAVSTSPVPEFNPWPETAALPDTVRPVVSNFAPTEGTTLDPLDEVEFDVTDDSGSFARNMIAVAFADGTQELVFDGQTFTALYLAGSTVAPTVIGQDAGFHYVLRRIGGWPGASIIVRAFSVDSSGNTES